MSQASQPGQFLLSIDLVPTRHAAARPPALAASAVAVAEHLAPARLPATWALELLTDIELARDLVGIDAEHEIALAADGSWAAARHERARVASELRRRAGLAAAAGFELRTAVFPEGPVTEHLDLLTRHGITAVRTIAPTQAASRAPGRRGWFRLRCREQLTLGVRSMQRGLWEIGPALDLAAVRPRVVRSALEQAASGGGLIHVSFNLADLAGNAAAGIRLIDGIVVQVDEFRRQSRMEILTVARLAAGLTRRRQQTPARSILRPAA